MEQSQTTRRDTTKRQDEEIHTIPHQTQHDALQQGEKRAAQPPDGTVADGEANMPERPPPAVEDGQQGDEDLGNDGDDHGFVDTQPQSNQRTARLPSNSVQLDHGPEAEEALDGPGASRRRQRHQITVAPCRRTLVMEVLVRRHLELGGQRLDKFKHCHRAEYSVQPERSSAAQWRKQGSLSLKTGGRLAFKGTCDVC